MLLRTGVGLDVEEVGMNALPSFPGEELQLLVEGEPEEPNEGRFSSLS